MRTDKKNIQILISLESYEKLKILASKRGTRIGEVVDYLIKKEKN